MKRLIGKLICWRKGHLRGTLRSYSATQKVFACPRCGRETRYKVKPA